MGGQHTGVQAAPGHGMFWPPHSGWHQYAVSDREHQSTRPTCTSRDSTLLGGPLEASHHTILDFTEVLHALGDVREDAGALPSGPKHQILRALATSCP